MNSKKLEEYDDLQLRQMALEGNALAETCIFKRYEAKVRDYLVKHACPLEDVDDVLMVSFTKVFRSLDKYTEEKGASFKTWLYTIAINAYKDWYHAYLENSKDVQSVEDCGVAYTISDDEKSIEDSIIAEERQEMIKNLLACLTDEQQRLIKMRTEKGMSYEEIADELDITLQNVKNKIHRAKTKLIELAENERKS